MLKLYIRYVSVKYIFIFVKNIKYTCNKTSIAYMAKLNVSAKINTVNGIHSVRLSLVGFKEEDGIFIIYSPALDLSGYGKNEEEAKKSFNEALIEFAKYTSDKNTTEKVLTSLGWKKIKESKYIPPKDTELVRINPQYSDIINNKDFKVTKENLELCY